MIHFASLEKFFQISFGLVSKPGTPLPDGASSDKNTYCSNGDGCGGKITICNMK